ncbi:transposase domain-containing protein [Sphingomonas silueang]|uniref:transposase domain-containing protein n=1 Tax=Sphingomonas silueang TaxID=3156617 RepID=UPI0032B38BC2
MIGGEWYTAAELADMKLPGLSSAKRKINDRAAADGWACATDKLGMPLARRRAGRGGGYEYHVSLLPSAARADLARRGVAVEAAANDAAPIAAGWDWLARQSDAVRGEASRRLAVLEQVDVLEASGMSRSSAVAAVAHSEGCSAQTIWNWLKLIRGVAAADRLPALAPRRAGGGKETDVDPDIWQALLSDYLRLSKPSWSTCIERTAIPLALAKGVLLPHARTLWRKFEKEVPPQVVKLRREGEEALRRMLPAQIRSVADLHAMQIVNIDGHRCDVFVRWPDGTIARPTMIAIQDVYSRKFLAWRHALTEDMVTARLVFADLFKTWGIPSGVLSDNGRAFASKWLTGGAKTRFRFKVRDEDPVGVLTALGITIHWAKPYRGQSKPIERGFRDFCDAIAKHPAFEGAYTGNSPMAKPENYGSKAVDLDVFLKVWNAGVAAHNARPGRRTEMGRGRYSFDTVFAESYARSPIGKATEEQLRIALLAADQVNVDRRTSTITLAGNKYWDERLVDLAGQRVTVRFDPDDLHQAVHVYDAQGRFVVTAAIWGATGFLTMGDAKDRQRLEQRWKKAAKAADAALDLLSADELVARLPAYADDETPPEPAVIRPVRVRGNTALKAAPAAQVEPFMDRFGAAVSRLKLVD